MTYTVCQSIPRVLRSNVHALSLQRTTVQGDDKILYYDLSLKVSGWVSIQNHLGDSFISLPFTTWRHMIIEEKIIYVVSFY